LRRLQVDAGPLQAKVPFLGQGDGLFDRESRLCHRGRRAERAQEDGPREMLHAPPYHILPIQYEAFFTIGIPNKKIMAHLHSIHVFMDPMGKNHVISYIISK
jgi:hypothetical protein